MRGLLLLAATLAGCQQELPSSSVNAPTACARPGAWQEGPLFTIARGGHHARLLPDGLVLVWGGSTNLHVREEYVAESFDPAGRKDGVGYGGLPPEATGDVPPPAATPGTSPAAALVRLPDGRVLAAGGAAPDGAPLRSVDIDGCAAVPMRSPRAGAAAVLLPDGRVLVTGGRTGGPREMDPFIRTTEVFTP